jgi:hypothetical protein
MGIGDLVCWKRLSGLPDYYDVGIVLNMETNLSPYAVFNLMVEVYFMRIGHLWCSPDYLKVISPYKG